MKKRPFVIDTDTGSDDVWAIIAGLRSPEIRVEAITTVCGNLPLELCVKNAKLAARAAGTYRPPVYEGGEKPLRNDRPFYAWDCHGADGLSGMDLPEPDYPGQREKAADALAALARRYAGELEIAACGPLTNIALACQKDESFARNVKRIYILGGAAGGRGNMTEQAEYNVYVDPDAARIVLDSALDAVWVSWDCAGGDAAFSGAELTRLAQSESGAARFCERCIRQMRDYYEKERGGGLAVIDSVLMLCALRPGLITESFSARCEICCDSGESYGAMRMERGAGEPNARIVAGIDARAYKDALFTLLGA